MFEKQNEEKLVTPYIEEFIKRYEIKRIHTDFFDKLVLLIIAGFGLITAFAWDDLFKEIFKISFGELTALQEKIVYAFFLTLFTALITVILTKFINKKKK